jgi:23S rRNA pseudouridine1911/1915/1917 synthase
MTDTTKSETVPDQTGAGCTHSVSVTGAGTRLDRFLAASLDGLSRSRLKALIEEGQVSCAGETITEPSYRVKQGQTFAIIVPDAKPAAPEPQAMALNVLYEDEDLIVIDKPAGLVVHPAPGNQSGTLVNALLAHCGDSLSGIGGVKRPGIVHRLDKDTSGLIIAAKNDRAHESLSAQFGTRTVERAYLALVWGIPRPGNGDIEGNIGRSARDRKKMAVRRTGGKAALTHYKVIRRFGTVASLVECRLATGRTHQIRVHLAHMGHPVMGDAQYGGGLTAARRRAAGQLASDFVTGLKRQALHAKSLGFKHPASGEFHRYESDLPLELRDLVAILESI